MTAEPSKPILKVLLVDDDADTRQIVSVMVAKAGHVLLTTGSGRDALALLHREKVDVILLDIMMPEMDGLSILETIRATSDAPILMLTAISNAAIMQQSYVLGADDYIVKPFTRQKLIDRIERLGSRVSHPVENPRARWTSRFWLDVKNGLLIRDGTAVDLTEIEAKIMYRLMEYPCLEVSNADLYETGWGSAEVSVGTARSMVEEVFRSLQSKLEANPDVPKILTATRDGFTFNPDTL